MTLCALEGRVLLERGLSRLPGDDILEFVMINHTAEGRAGLHGTLGVVSGTERHPDCCLVATMDVVAHLDHKTAQPGEQPWRGVVSDFPTSSSFSRLQVTVAPSRLSGKHHTRHLSHPSLLALRSRPELNHGHSTAQQHRTRGKTPRYIQRQCTSPPTCWSSSPPPPPPLRPRQTTACPTTAATSRAGTALLM